MKGADLECACQSVEKADIVKKASFRDNADSGFSPIKDEIQDSVSV